MKAHKILFSKRKGYWQKIRATMRCEEEICEQINNNEVAENDKYMLGRACVRNGYMLAYMLLSLLPEVNIITEAYVYNKTLFNELFTANSKYVAMDDREEVAFNPQEISEWYNIGATYVNTKKAVKPVWGNYFEREDMDYGISATKLYLSDKHPSFVWDGMKVLISYVCYHGIEPACDKWLKYDISYYRSYIQHGIMKSLSFAKYCYNRQDMVCDDAIRRTILNMLIMNDIIPECDHTIPYCIWYPKVPQESTLRELVAKVPKLAILAGRVCAIAHYNELYDSLNIPADEATYQEAIAGGNEYIVKKLAHQERKHFMNDHTYSRCYSPDKPFERDCFIHTADKVDEYYNKDRTGVDEKTGYVPRLYNLINENTQTCDTLPSLQPGLGVQENSFLLN